MEVRGVLSSQIDDVWQNVADFISKGLERGGDGDWVLDDVKTGLANRDMQLWVAHGDQGNIVGAVVTQILNYPRFKSCLILSAGGANVLEARQFVVQRIAEWAKNLGCTKMELLGRKGWERALPDWRVTGVFYRRDI